MNKLLLVIAMIVLASALIFGGCAKPAPTPPTPTPTPTPAPAPVPKPEPITWRLNSWHPLGHAALPNLEWAASEIAKRSNGELIIVVYPAFSLGFKPDTWLRDHKAGLIDISDVVNLYVGGEEPSLLVIESANMWKDRERSKKAVQAISDFKESLYKNVWNSELIATGTMWAKTSVIATREKQVKTLDDVKRLKLRVDSPRTKTVFEVLGASPLFMPLGEVYMALKTGVVDGYVGGWSGIYLQKHHEALKYVIDLVGSPALQEDIVVSARVWDPLPTHLKQIVRDVFAEWADKSWEAALAGRADAEDKKLCQKAGIITSDLSEAEKIRLRELIVKLQGEWALSQGGRVAEVWAIVEPIVRE